MLISRNRFRESADFYAECGRIWVKIAERQILGNILYITDNKSVYDDETFEVGLEFVDTPPDVISSLIGHLYTVEK